jgi:hypothetical protein
MIGMYDAKDFIDKMPWPEDAPRPILRMWVHELNFMVLLHENHARGWGDVARMIGPTPEAALACALGEWLRKHGLNNQPALFASIKKLTN